MMKMFKKYFFLILFSLISLNSFAVEGYKSLKFGMSKQQVLKSKLCSFKDLGNTEGIKHFNTLACNDLKFGGDTVFGTAIFIKNKLLRFMVISQNSGNLINLIDSLEKKYGKVAIYINDKLAESKKDLALIDRHLGITEKFAIRVTFDDEEHVWLYSETKNGIRTTVHYDHSSYNSEYIRYKEESLELNI